MRTRRSTERGAGLVEILVAMAILGIATVGLLGAVMTVARTSRGHSDQAKAEAILASAAEVLRSDAVTWRSCAAPADYLNELEAGLVGFASIPSGWTVDIVDPILDWNGSTFVDDPSPSDFCDNPDLPLQLVSVVVRDGGRTIESVAVVKS